ncbi:MAG: hypothetical protein JXJ17_14365 [Anaerolineae bacterium]|nr:hypothetical protein [Anaerolineae bacterium]
MNETTTDTAYEWTGRDKALYALSLVPFLIGFLGAAYLMGTISIILTVILFGLYGVVCVFMAYCCVPCPYRGRFCPALFGVYPGNMLSPVLYPKAEYSEKAYNFNVTAGEITTIVILIYMCVGLALIRWWYIPILLALTAIHIVMFYAFFCPKCGNRRLCPMGISACKMCGQSEG